MICGFVCRLPLIASTLNLFNRVVHFDGASGPTGLIAARMTVKSLKSRKDLMVALYEQIQKMFGFVSHGVTSDHSFGSIESVYYIAIVVHVA